MIPIVLFSAVAMLFCVEVPAGAREPSEPGWYRSNALGMLLEPIAEGSREEYEYILLVEREERQETRALYREGDYARETVREFSDEGIIVSEEEWDYGELSVRREFDEDGRLSVEYHYEHDEPGEGDVPGEDRARGPGEDVAPGEDVVPSSVDFFSYRDGRLYERRREDGDGNELFTERYRYRREGLLRRVERTFSADDGTGQSEFLYSDEELREEWHERDGVSVLVRYDRWGRLVRTEERRDNVLVLSEQLFYPDGDDARDIPPERSKRVEPERGRQTVTEYDEDGRTIAERRYEDDEQVEEREFQYEDDLLVLELVRDDDGEQERRYTYDEDGERISEERTRDGVPERRIEFDGDKRTEHRYVDGALSLIIEFDGEDRVREQVVRDGEVVRERRF